MQNLLLEWDRRCKLSAGFDLWKSHVQQFYSHQLKSWTIDVQIVLSQYPRVAWKILNPDSLSSNETSINPGIRSWKKITHLNKLDVWNPLVVPISQRSQELRLCNLVLNLTISNPGLKAVSSNATPGWMLHVFGGDTRDFLTEGVKTYLLSPILPLNWPTFFLSSHL
jgi:hypothetical protein